MRTRSQTKGRISPICVPDEVIQAEQSHPLPKTNKLLASLKRSKARSPPSEPPAKRALPKKQSTLGRFVPEVLMALKRMGTGSFDAVANRRFKKLTTIDETASGTEPATESDTKSDTDSHGTSSDAASATASNKMAVEVTSEGQPPKLFSVERRPGKSAHRWLPDLLEGQARDFCDGDGIHGITAMGDLFVPCNRAALPKSLILPGAADSQGRHELCIIESQSIDGKMLSCICSFCKYHFLFHFERDPTATCPRGTPHWLVRRGVEDGAPELPAPEGVVDKKYFPVDQAALWHCASVQCTFKVMVYMTFPRLSINQVAIVADKARIEKQRTDAIRLDPERFKDLPSTVSDTSLMTLNAYLRDVTGQAEGSPRIKIATRNKRFLVQFGEPCTEFLEYLGFEMKEINDETYWLLPELQHYGGKTPIGTHRAFLEDVRSEVQALVTYPGGTTSQSTSTAVAPVPAISWLRQALDLHLSPAPSQSSSNNQQNPQAANNDSYSKLGVLPHSNNDAVMYGYRANVAIDPARESVYLDAIREIAEHRDQDFQLFAVSEVSLAEARKLEESRNHPLSRALIHFGIDPDMEVTDDFILQKFRVLRQASPAQAGQHFLKLATIARWRDSELLLNEAVCNMTFHAASQILSLGDGIKDAMNDPSLLPDVEIINIHAQTALQDGGDHVVISAALTAIGDVFLPLREQLYGLSNNMAGIQNANYAHTNANLGVIPAAKKKNSAAWDPSMPLGLQNLRNTCYMNSILQYFYTVTPVRVLVETWPTDGAEEIDDFPELMTTEQAEVYVGRELLNSLKLLFADFKHAKGKNVRPRQQLANVASLDISKVARDTADALARSATPANATTSTAPPPLPTRPGAKENDTISTSIADEATVTVSSIEKPSEFSPPASVASSQTLIDHPMEDSVEVIEPAEDAKDEAEPTPGDAPAAAQHTTAKRVISKGELDKVLDQATVSGTEQMDVEEIMGRFIGYIRAAINKKSTEDQNLPDAVFNTFYVEMFEARKDEGKDDTSHRTWFERWVTAYPSEDGPRTMYEALDVGFDREVIPTGGASIQKYNAIKMAPPILHVFLQRTRDTKDSPVEIPAELYLDRYMYAPEDSDLFIARKRSWNIKQELEEHKKVQAAGAATSPATSSPEQRPSTPGVLEENSFTMSDKVPVTTDEDDGYVMVGGDDNLDQDMVVVGAKDDEDEIMEDYAAATTDTNTAVPSEAAPPPARPTSNPEELTAELAGLFTGMTDHRYRLHAVICHAGQMNAGHYWVWIFDFAAGVWRKYNDTNVTERSADDVAAVLAELSSTGQPYYAAYVRDDDKDEFVLTPPRAALLDAEEEGEDGEPTAYAG